jgi:hypothetical protein
MNRSMTNTGRSWIDQQKAGDFSVWLIGLLIAAPVLVLLFHGELRLVITFVFVAILAMAWIYNRTVGLMASFVFLIALGDIRRIADMLVGPAPGSDTLLIVGAIVTIYISLPLFFGLKLSDNTSKAVLALMAVMVLEIFNPRQGPLAVGLAGALFYIIPFLWFWIGRQYATEKILYALIYKVFVPLGVIAALLGIVQTYIGFLPWEEIWVKSMGHMYELSAGHFRSFGFSTNTIEYTSVLLIATTCIIAAFLNGRRTYILLLAIMLPAILLASSRGLIVKLVFTCAMLWAVLGKKGKAWIPRLIFALVLGLGLIVYSATRAESSSDTVETEDVTTAQSATSHVTGGLAHPFDEKHSTAGFHVQIIGEAILRGFTYPIGYGLGSVTLAANKFSGENAAMVSSEFDISDAFTAMGFVGGLLYLYIVLVILRDAMEYTRTGPSTLSLPILGILVGLIGGWTGLGQYPVGPFMMFLLGFIVRNKAMKTVPDKVKNKGKSRNTLGSKPRITPVLPQPSQ